MSKKRQMTREEAIEELRQYGIEGSDLYLIDVIPLLEILWADGKAQGGEVAVVTNYLKRHVQHINGLAQYEVLTEEQATRFVNRFLKQRPEPGLLRTLRSFIAPLRLSGSEPIGSDVLRESLLAACLDIAAISVARYPYGLQDRFNLAEKRCFFEILESL